jgi:hypothetical protein
MYFILIYCYVQRTMWDNKKDWIDFQWIARNSLQKLELTDAAVESLKKFMCEKEGYLYSCSWWESNESS